MEWRDIKGFEGKYKICKETREVIRYPYDVTQVGLGGKTYTRHFGEKVLTENIDSEGYPYYSIGRKTYRTHWLLYNTFVGDSNGMFIDHIDRDRTNNDLSNLRLVTPRESVLNRTLKFKPDIQDWSKHQKYKNKEKSHPYCLRFSDEGKRWIVGFFRTYDEAVEKYKELYIEREMKNHVSA